MSLNFAAQCLGRRIQDVAHEVGLAPLPGHPLEVLTNGFDQSAMMVGDDDVDTAQVPAFQARRKIHSNWLPIRCRPASDPRFHDNRRVDTMRDHHTPGTNPSFFPHLEDQSIHHEKRENGCHESGVRSRPVTMGSRRLHNSETVDLENSVTAKFFRNLATFRVETPLTTISIKASTKACSLRW